MVDRLCPWASYVCAPPKEEGVSYQHHFWNPPGEEVCHICNFLKINQDRLIMILVSNFS